MQSKAARAHTHVSATAGPIPAGCCLLHHCAYMPDMIRGCLHLLASFCASLPASLVFSAAFSTRPPVQNRSLESDVESSSSMCEGYISSLTQALPGTTGRRCCTGVFYNSCSWKLLW